MSEEESSASSSSSETQTSQARCTGLSEHKQVRAAAAATASTSVVTTQKRKAGRKKFRETRHPIFRGVRERNGGKWVCEVREPNKKSRIWLGTFPSPDMAARAYDVAALALRGKSALLNFPHSASNLPKAKSSSARDIQLAALQAAELFPPPPQAVATSAPSAAELPNVKEGRQGEKTEESMTFVDEEEMLNMPALLDSMAEGMLLTPPSMKQRFSWDDVDCQVDMSLWSDG